MTTSEQLEVINALEDLVYGGEFAAWMRTTRPEMPYAAAREYNEAAELVKRLMAKAATR